MAHLLPNYVCPNISKGPYNESSFRYTSISGKTRSLERKRGLLMVQCCSSSSTSSAEEVGLVEKLEVDGNLQVGKGHFGRLISEYGWKARRLVEEEEEMRMAVRVQAEAFHEPVALFNDFFFQFFQAEVLSGLAYKLRNSPPDRYACLVAEPTNDGNSESQKELVGVVDVTVSRDEGVLEHLQGAQEYIYVSGIAVLSNFRRRKVATVLLKACDMVSILWGFEYLALRAYEDDWGARKLYANAGYKVVSGDPPWLTTWIGRRRRVLLIKRSNLRDWY